MKRKNKDEIVQFSFDELEKRSQDIRSKLAVLSIERYTKHSKNSRELNNMRRELAYVLTVKRQKELIHE